MSYVVLLLIYHMVIKTVEDWNTFLSHQSHNPVHIYCNWNTDNYNNEKKISYWISILTDYRELIIKRNILDNVKMF